MSSYDVVTTLLAAALALFGVFVAHMVHWVKPYVRNFMYVLNVMCCILIAMIAKTCCG